MVLLMAPEMKGCAAAIMRMWPSGAMKRVPRLPQRLAQSNTGRCLSLRCGAPSTVCVPQMRRLSASICLRPRPRARRPLNFWSARALAGSIPSAAITRSGMLHALNAKEISKTVGRLFSICTTSSPV